MTLYRYLMMNFIYNNFDFDFIKIKVKGKNLVLDIQAIDLKSLVDRKIYTVYSIKNQKEKIIEIY